MFLQGLDDEARVETELLDKAVDDLLLLVVELLYQLSEKILPTLACVNGDGGSGHADTIPCK